MLILFSATSCIVSNIVGIGTIELLAVALEEEVVVFVSDGKPAETTPGV